MNTLDSYFRSQQVSLQWSPVLRALALELSAQADLDALRQLFIKTGMRYAQSMEPRFQGIKTLAELTDSLNDLWSQTNWGCVAFREASNHIEIEHRFAPLSEAFGDEMLNWSVGILEGFYQAVFVAFGADERMATQCVAQQDDGLCVQIHLTLQ